VSVTGCSCPEIAVVIIGHLKVGLEHKKQRETNTFKTQYPKEKP
jgi:hypothetical protein